jgi:hypothetical protein
MDDPAVLRGIDRGPGNVLDEPAAVQADQALVARQPEVALGIPRHGVDIVAGPPVDRDEAVALEVREA